MLSDYYAYDSLQFLAQKSEDYICLVNICDTDYGLTRVKVPDADESYYYVPAIFFYGNVQYQGKETGILLDVDVEEVRRSILVLNAIDGSIINITNG